MRKAGRWPVWPGGWAGLAAALGFANREAVAMLSLEGAGRWAVSQAGSIRPLRLVHVWPAFAWVTLRFQEDTACIQGKPLEFTVWKAGLSDGEWRDLRRCVAAQQAMPEPGPKKEAA